MPIKTDYENRINTLNNHPRVNGYISPYTETKVSPIDGLGLFSARDIHKNEVVAAWGGHILTKDEISDLPDEISYNYALEIYPGFYLAETQRKELDRSDFINHSCDPNCKIVNKLIMITKRKIHKGEELTCDFSAKNNKGNKIICTCNSKKCKKSVYF
ncbi:MAG: SET domain-containing protein-lysine N-methyltransferase [Candidatus Absconditabacterales bacterium]